MKHDSLGDRMKFNYEEAYKIRLPLRMPFIVRIDGSSFHTFTKGMERPFDSRFSEAMMSVAQEVFRRSAGCVLAYGQSDEISFLFHDYKKLGSQAWFSGELQKIVSITAGIASASMTRFYSQKDLAFFDARAFVLPENEVANYFIWRQKDAERNSLSMLAQSYFSSKELHGKKRSDMHDMLHGKGVNWNNEITVQKRGFCIRRTEEGGCFTDTDIPVFTEDRNYIERNLVCDNET